MDNDFGLFAQDRWTMDRLTLNLALRFDSFQTSFPEQTVGPAPLVTNPEHHLPRDRQPQLEGHHLPDRLRL